MTIGSTLKAGLEALGLAPSAKSQLLADSLIQESEAERQRIRHAQIADRAANLGEQTSRSLAFEPRRAAALAAVERKQAELQAAIEARHVIEHAHRGEMLDLSMRCGRIEGALLASASPQIEAFMKEMQAAWQATFEERDSISERTIAGSMRETWTNVASVDRRATAIRAVMEIAPGLAFEPLDDTEVEVRLSDLRDSLPAVESRPLQHRHGAVA